MGHPRPHARTLHQACLDYESSLAVAGRVDGQRREFALKLLTIAVRARRASKAPGTTAAKRGAITAARTLMVSVTISRSKVSAVDYLAASGAFDDDDAAAAVDITNQQYKNPLLALSTDFAASRDAAQQRQPAHRDAEEHPMAPIRMTNPMALASMDSWMDSQASVDFDQDFPARAAKRAQRIDELKLRRLAPQPETAGAAGSSDEVNAEGTLGLRVTNPIAGLTEN